MLRRLFSLFVMLCLCGLSESCNDQKNCQQCSYSAAKPEGYCERCEDSVWNEQSKTCDASIPRPIQNCRFYNSSDIKRCQECELGYFLNSVTQNCVKCVVSNCALCDEAQKCKGCLNRLSLDFENNVCKENEMCPIDNCSLCAIDNNNKEYCEICDQSFAKVYTKIKDNCIAAIDHCYATDSHFRNTCQICDSGFYISTDGKCLQNSDIHQKESPWTIVWLSIIGVSAVLFSVTAFVQYRNSKASRDEFIIA